MPGDVSDSLIDVVRSAKTSSLRIFDLGRPLIAGMPQSPNHPQFRLALQRRHGDMVRADGSSAANEVIVTGGHVGTHIDALAHVSYAGLLHGGIDAAAAQVGGRFSQLGVETIEPMVCRGLLLDVPAALGIEGCPPGYEITPTDLDAALTLAGREACPGDVLLVRSGWGQRYGDPEAYVGKASGVPGPGEAGRAMAQRQAAPGRRCGHARLRALAPRPRPRVCCPRIGTCWSRRGSISSRQSTWRALPPPECASLRSC